MSQQKKNFPSSHVVKFTTSVAVQVSGDTIAVTFPSDFNFGDTFIGDMTFTHGPTTGAENTETLAAAPSATAWGAVFSGTENRILTLTTPTDGIGAAALAANDKVILTYAVTGIPRNASTAGTFLISIAIAGTNTATGQIAVVILDDDQVVVNATIDPYITFTITTNTVTLTKSGGGNPSYTSTGYNQGAANTLAAATNGATGYTITYNGATLTSGAHTIDAMAVKAASSAGTEQFGINLKDNATPNTGAEPSGGTGAPAADYNTADQFKFVAGATTSLATAAAPTATTTFTVTYIANVTAVTEAAAYQTTITYICTGNF